MAHLGFRLGIYIYKEAEVIDFAAPYGVFAVARRLEPSLEVFFIAEALRPVQAQAGFTVLPQYSLDQRPAMDAFLIPGGFGSRVEMYNQRLLDFVRSLPEECLVTSVCTGSWVLAQAGLLEGKPATSRKEGDPIELSPRGMIPIDRLAKLSDKIEARRERVVDAGRIITAGGIASGMELGFYLLERAGFDERFIQEVARIMEYTEAYNLYRNDRLV